MLFPSTPGRLHMAGSKMNGGNGAKLGFEKKFWQAADKMMAGQSEKLRERIDS